MPTDTQAAFLALSLEFPLRPAGFAADQVPNLANSLDQELVGTIDAFEIDPIETALNPLRVEDLLSSCLARISSCMILREKAHEVQIRAFTDAIENTYQRILVENQVELDALASGLNSQAATDHRLAIKRATTEPLDYKKSMAEEPGHGSNYTERYAFLKEMFDLNLLQAIARARQVQKGLDQVYQIPAPLPPVAETGYLNALAKWAQKASDKLDVELDRRRWRKVSIAFSSPDDNPPSGQIFTRTNFNTRRDAGAFDFPLNAEFFTSRGITEPLLREVQLQIVSNEPTEPRLWQCTIRPPANPLIAGEIAFPCIAANGDSSAAVQFAVSGDVHNFSPIGNWSIRVPVTPITGEATVITNVILSLTVSSRRA